MVYQGHAADGGIQNHSAGESLRAGYIIGMDSGGWFAQCAKTGERSNSYQNQRIAVLAGQIKCFSRPAKQGTFTGGGRACRPAAL